MNNQQPASIPFSPLLKQQQQYSWFLLLLLTLRKGAIRNLPRFYSHPIETTITVLVVVVVVVVVGLQVVMVFYVLLL